MGGARTDHKKGSIRALRLDAKARVTGGGERGGVLGDGGAASASAHRQGRQGWGALILHPPIDLPFKIKSNVVCSNKSLIDLSKLTEHQLDANNPSYSWSNLSCVFSHTLVARKWFDLSINLL
jgi:hypothetical protein